MLELGLSTRITVRVRVRVIVDVEFVYIGCYAGEYVLRRWGGDN